jgi:hypothetical protein
MQKKTRRGGGRMRPQKKTLKRSVRPKVNIIGIQKYGKKKSIFTNMNSENIKNIVLSDPIEYLERVQEFLETLSDRANRALASGNQRGYDNYTSIANIIAEAVVDTFKKHSKLLKDETDELADLLMSTTMSGDAKNIKEDFAELMDESRIFEEPLDYIDDLAEYIEDFVELYDHVLKTKSMKHKLNSMSEFASHLSADLRSAIRFAREHFREMGSHTPNTNTNTNTKNTNNSKNKNNNMKNNSMPTNYASVNSASVAVANTKNSQVNSLANLFESTFTKAFGK